ncbi:LVIVD repeat-containing protein [Arundinibacter roseus]|uniref:LVIVD repeat-containing protein n=1 Tax=Arundinibacter roseus TaxID=2070510 RepID=A0A4R4KMB8_9BACT|nr:hypothetical protein [Arundinibacter roseus]TDB68166.1 hypothetical protein EZE20_04375 [Arundinibacter roseus]
MKKSSGFSLFGAWAILASALLLSGCEAGNSADIGPGSQSGVGGSMARFAITGNTLYIATKQSLDVYDISQADAPVKTDKTELGVGVETIFPYKNNLYIGAIDGMYIFDNSQPRNPRLLSKYEHFMSCDPVVVQDQYAYVTLRTGTVCRQFISMSVLEVVDISNPMAPQLVHTTSMTSPYGLGVDGKHLFVGEGSRGLKLFDISNPAEPKLMQFRSDIPTYDVIPYRSTLIITGEKGIFQYRYDEDEQFDFLSKIPVE